MGRNGGIVAHYEYSPFGSLTKLSGDYAVSNPFRFSSEYFDEETALVYYNYRYYNPELGRWISRDPIEEQGGYNLYNILGNNPLYGWDNQGLWGHAVWCLIKRLFKIGKDAKDINDTIDSANESVENAKTITDPKASPGDKARASTEEISKQAASGKRNYDARSAKKGGQIAGKEIDKISEAQNTNAPTAASRSQLSYWMNDAMPYRSDEKVIQPGSSKRR